MSADTYAEVNGADREVVLELGELIENAEDDWMRDALHAIVGLIGGLADQTASRVIETLRYELADPDPQDDDEEPLERPVTTLYLPGDAP